MSNVNKKSLIAFFSLFIVFGAWAQTKSPTPVGSAKVAAPTVPQLSDQGLTQLRQLLAAGKLDEALQLAQSAGMDIKSFATFAAQNGVSVAAITTTVLNSGAAPTEGLKALGEAFATNAEAVAAVFATAITMPGIKLDAATVASSIQAGCTNGCLPAAVVSTLTKNTATKQLRLAPTPVPTSTANSTTSGSGSGGTKPISPTS